jgi:hypothetical protein
MSSIGLLPISETVLGLDFLVRLRVSVVLEPLRRASSRRGSSPDERLVLL